jgi:hypothetical protein
VVVVVMVMVVKATHFQEVVWWSRGMHMGVSGGFRLE